MTRRPWRSLHIPMDAGIGQIAAAAIPSDIDDVSLVGVLIDQVTGPVELAAPDGPYDQNGVYGAVAARHPLAEGRWLKLAALMGADISRFERGHR